MTPTPALVPAERSAPPAATITPDQLALIRTTIAKGATDDELRLFLFDNQRQGVHPLDKLIHFTKRSGRYAPVTSIDFMRIRAAQTGECAGIDDAVFVGEPKTPAFAATTTVWRLVGGQRCAFSATARWSEYKPESNDFMWLKMPFTMLGKCAEALALRRGFPQQLAGLYAKEEFDQAPADVNLVTGEIREPIRPGSLSSDDSEHVDPPTITAAQRTRLFALARAKGWTTAQLRAHLLAKYSLHATSDLMSALYDTVCADIEIGPPAAPSAEPEEPF
jgi:phage recombination protein Bet